MKKIVLGTILGCSIYDLLCCLSILSVDKLKEQNNKGVINE